MHTAIYYCKGLCVSCEPAPRNWQSGKLDTPTRVKPRHTDTHRHTRASPHISRGKTDQDKHKHMHRHDRTQREDAAADAQRGHALSRVSFRVSSRVPRKTSLHCVRAHTRAQAHTNKHIHTLSPSLSLFLSNSLPHTQKTTQTEDILVNDSASDSVCVTSARRGARVS